MVSGNYILFLNIFQYVFSIGGDVIRGLILSIGAVLSLVNVAEGASFGCYGKLTDQENMICSNETLSAMDFRLNALYSVAVKAVKQAESLRSGQRDWLQSVRAKCTDVSCLTDAYQHRIETFDGIVRSAASPFPSEIKGRIHHRAIDSPYCKVSGNAGTENGDWFSIDASVKGQAVSGSIDGIFDCGRKVWGEIQIKGRLIGNIALVEFQPGFSSDKGHSAEALIVITPKWIYWRVLSEIEGESYVSRNEDIRIQNNTR